MCGVDLLTTQMQLLFLGDLAESCREREKEEKIMPSLMANSLRWRTHSAQTKSSQFLASNIHLSFYFLPYYYYKLSLEFKAIPLMIVFK
jgi:hypothetical protein